MQAGDELTRYWFEFEYKTYNNLPAGLTYGCGITAYSYDDALGMLKQKVFTISAIADIKKVTENIDISTLDPGHVLPNMTIPVSERGIWYPSGYSDYF